MSEDEYDSSEAIQPIANPTSVPGRHHTPSHRKGPRFSWNPQYEATFFRSLCESVKMGLKDNHSFKSEAWDRACAALAERHNAYPNKGHLINKGDNARKKFRLWRGLREDPEFLYNPKTKIVTASEAAWRAHIQREPLSKSLRNRAFEHEDYMEILFPDVIGSGGAPKRITRPRRKGLDALPDADDLETPGTNVMNLLSPSTTQAIFQAPAETPPALPPTVPSNGTVHPASTTVQNRASVASSSALTPPDDETTPQTNQSRKHFLAPTNASGPSEKRRRTPNNNIIDLTHPAQLMNIDTHNQPDGGNTVLNSTLNSTLNNASNSTSNSTNNHASQLPVNNNHSSSGGSAPVPRQQLQEAMIALNEFVRNFRNTPPQPPPTPRWQEQAMETFFRDFAEEDPDLQIRIGEKVLCDTNKAMMFCMMSDQLRKHWVKRLRELYNRHEVSALGMNSNNQANTMNPTNMGNAVGAGLNGGGINGSNGLMNGGGMGAGMMQMGPVTGGGGMGRNGSQVG